LLFIARADSSQDIDHSLGRHVFCDLVHTLKIAKNHHASAKFTPSRRNACKLALMRARIQPAYRDAALIGYHVHYTVSCIACCTSEKLSRIIFAIAKYLLRRKAAQAKQA